MKWFNKNRIRGEALLRRMNRKDWIVLMPTRTGGVEIISSKEMDSEMVTKMLESLVAERRAESSA